MQIVVRTCGVKAYIRQAPLTMGRYIMKSVRVFRSTCVRLTRENTINSSPVSEN